MIWNSLEELVESMWEPAFRGRQGGEITNWEMEKLKQQEEITQMKHSAWQKKKKKCNRDQGGGQEENNQNHRA